MLIYNYQKEFIGIDEADLKVFGFADLAELKSEASDFADMFVRTPGYIHNFKHVHWIDFVTCAEPSDESKVIIEVNAKTYKANIEIETIYLSDNPTAKAYLIHLNHLRGLTLKENGEISEDVARQRPKKVEPNVGFAFNSPKESVRSENSENLDSLDVIKEIPELEGFKPFDEIIEEDVTEVHSYAPLDISFDDDIDEPTLSTTDLTHKKEINKESSQAIEIEDTYSIDTIDVEGPQEEEPVPADDNGFDYSYDYDPQVASDELGLPIDLIEEFIQDFIVQAKEFKNELFDSLHDGDLDNVKVLSHKLKGVAANLRIEDAFNTLSIINTSSDITEVESNLHIFYKIITKLSGEDIQTAKTIETQAKEIKDESDLYEDDLITDLKAPIQENENEEISDEIEISIQEEETKEEETKEEKYDLIIKDSEVPQKIEMPELADDEFLNDITEDAVSEDIDMEDLFSIDIEDKDEEKRSSDNKESLNIDDGFKLEEEFEITVVKEPLKIDYSKEIIASEIGLDQESFNEIFDDYIIDSQASIKTINEAILEDDYNKCKKEALKLKGMSDNMRMNAFNDQLNTLINSSDKNELTEATTKIDAAIAQISK